MLYPHDETEAHSLVQTSMEPAMGEESSDDDVVFNMAPLEKDLVHEFTRTLNVLWDRGEQMVAESVALRACQLGSQMQEARFTDLLIWDLAVCGGQALLPTWIPAYLPGASVVGLDGFYAVHDPGACTTCKKQKCCR